MKRKTVPFAVLCILVSMATGCAPYLALERKQPARPIPMLVSTDWLANHLGALDLVVVHVSKKRDSYEAGHIPGARFLSWDEISMERDGVQNELRPAQELTQIVRRLGIGTTNRVVLYDDEFGIPAARAYVTLDYLGLGDRTALLDGQLNKWKAEGHKLTTAVPEYEPSNFLARINPDVIIERKRVSDLAMAADGSAVLIDARPEEQYCGEDPGKGITRPGHIPSARNVHSTQNIVSEENPVFRPTDELKSLYSNAGAKSGGLVVPYCRTGGQASLTYFALKSLGYNARLYDGSYSEWSEHTEDPVVKSKEPK